MVLFDADNESRAYSAFFKGFNSGKFKNSLAFVRESSRNFNETLTKILYSALPIVMFYLNDPEDKFYCLRTVREDVENDAKVLITPEDIESFWISECSAEEFSNAPTSTNFHRFIFPVNRLNGNYFKIRTSTSFSPLYLQRDSSIPSLDVLKFKLPLKHKQEQDIPLLDNPAFPVCMDLSRFINEIVSLPEVTNSVQDTFLEVIDEILGWSRNHDPSPFPGTTGLKSNMQMYLRLFEEFEDRIKTVHPDSPASRTFEIALKKMTPCTRSIKRQLLKLSDDEPSWLSNAKQYSDAETRKSRQLVPKRQKSTSDLPEGAISMPLLVPYLSVEWPVYTDIEPISPYHIELKQAEQKMLDTKRFAE